MIFIDFFSLVYCLDLEEDGGLGNLIKWIYLVSLLKIRYLDSFMIYFIFLVNKIIFFDIFKWEYKFFGF